MPTRFELPAASAHRAHRENDRFGRHLVTGRLWPLSAFQPLSDPSLIAHTRS